MCVDYARNLNREGQCIVRDDGLAERIFFRREDRRLLLTVLEIVYFILKEQVFISRYTDKNRLYNLYSITALYNE